MLVAGVIDSTSAIPLQVSPGDSRQNSLKTTRRREVSVAGFERDPSHASGEPDSSPGPAQTVVRSPTRAWTFAAMSIASVAAARRARRARRRAMLGHMVEDHLRR